MVLKAILRTDRLFIESKSQLQKIVEKEETVYLLDSPNETVVKIVLEYDDRERYDGKDHVCTQVYDINMQTAGCIDYAIDELSSFAGLEYITKEEAFDFFIL